MEDDELQIPRLRPRMRIAGVGVRTHLQLTLSGFAAGPRMSLSDAIMLEHSPKNASQVLHETVVS